MNSIAESPKEYPYNLLDDIEAAEWDNELPPDFEGTLAYVLFGLNERQRTVILGIYKYRKTYEVIGKELGLTRARVGQIRRTALYRLRHPSQKNISFTVSKA